MHWVESITYLFAYCTLLTCANAKHIQCQNIQLIILLFRNECKSNMLQHAIRINNWNWCTQHNFIVCVWSLTSIGYHLPCNSFSVQWHYHGNKMCHMNYSHCFDASAHTILMYDTLVFQIQIKRDASACIDSKVYSFYVWQCSKNAITQPSLTYVHLNDKAKSNTI